MSDKLTAAQIEEAAAIVGAEVARMVHRRRVKTWARFSVWTHAPKLRVDLFQEKHQVGFLVALEEIACSKNPTALMRSRIDLMVTNLEKDIEESE